MTEIDDDTEALLMKRVYDMAGTVRDVKVFLNDERLKVKGFKQVSRLQCVHDVVISSNRLLAPTVYRYVFAGLHTGQDGRSWRRRSEQTNHRIRNQ